MMQLDVIAMLKSCRCRFMCMRYWAGPVKNTHNAPNGIFLKMKHFNHSSMEIRYT